MSALARAAATLTASAAHLWRLPPAAKLPPTEAMTAALDKVEKQRLATIKHPEKAALFLRAHYFTRAVLAAYAQTTAAALPLSVTAAGKPFIPDGQLKFSLSHSADLAYLAVSLQEIGLDVESENTKRPAAKVVALAKRYFTASEAAAVAAAPKPAAHFLKIWTLKEAYLKGLGCGLRQALDSFTLTLDANNAVSSQGTVAGWHLTLLTEPAATIALAAPTAVTEIQRFCFADALCSEKRRHSQA